MKTKIWMLACMLFVCNVNVQAALVAYWPLNEGTGQIAGDASGNGNDGTLGDTTSPENADPAWVTDAVRGNVLEWVGDDAPDEWVNLTSHVGNFSSLNQGTITAWIKIPGGDVQDIILCASDSGDGSSEIRFTYEAGTLQYDIRDDSSNPVGESGNLSAPGVNDNAWHFVAVTVDAASNANLYIDGQLVDSDSESFFSGVRDLDHMSLGRNIDSGGVQWAFKGRMSDVAVFDTPLPADTIAAINNGLDILDVDKQASDPSPANGAGHVPAATTLSWQSNATNPRYTVYLETDPAFPSGPAATGLTSASYSPALSAATTYYWQVDVKEGGITYPGLLWSFITEGKATDPDPVHNEVGVFTSPTLSWTGDGSIGSYDVYLAEDGQPLTFKTNTAQTQYAPSELNEYTTYNWRVDTRDGGGALIATGDVWTFTTQASGAFFEEIDLFVGGTEGYACYRIPSIIKAPNGDVLAFCEGRLDSCHDRGNVDIVMKRSTDNGQTWGPLEVLFDEGGYTIANPTPVVDESTGRLWMPFNRNYYDPSYKVYISYSDDSGHTWAPRVEITQDVTEANWYYYGVGPGVAIQLKSEPYRGRLVVPCYHFSHDGVTHGDHMIYSDDHGATWTNSERILPGFDECQVVELIDGTLMVNARTYDVDPDHRGIATSTDGGETWSEGWFHQELPEPTCQGSFLRFTRSDTEDINRVLFSNPAHVSSRVNVTVKMSYDEGNTWPVAKSICPGPSAYSCMAVMPDWTLGCLYEKDDYSKITLARFSVEWLTDGADTLDFCTDVTIEGDVTNDCLVNLDDFALMVANWLQCNLIPQKACP